MSANLPTRLTQGMAWGRTQLHQIPAFQPIIRRLRAGRIKSGVGAGLWFDPGVSNPEYRQGINEIPVQEIFSRYLGTGDICYDVGANVGFFTVIAAKLVGKSGHVYAFEPVPENTQVIRRNIKANGFENVSVLETAVSNTSGNGELQLAHYSGGATLASNPLPPDWKGTIAVKLLAIDDLLKEKRAKPPNFIKIDVEGAELEVLQGMQKTIKTYQPIILFEIDDNAEQRFQQKVEACSTFLQHYGYQIEPLLDAYPLNDWLVGHYLALTHWRKHD